MAAFKEVKAPVATPQLFPVVGVGASAGGLDAFKRLLTAIPEDSGMAYVLVQHLSPTHESILPEILQRVTKIPVHEITDEIHLAPNHIYIIPAAKILSAYDGVLSLSPRENFKTNLPIDIFFKSLAEVHKELAVGVVLSGTGSDGTLGLKDIKDYGGITIAQDSESSSYKDMPQHAVDSGVVDFILPPEEIPGQLLQINSNFPKTTGVIVDDTPPRDDEIIFKQILLLLHQRSGVDFTYYKQNTIHRRIARRIGMRKKEKLSSYLKFLRGDKAEQDALFQDMLIPVTSFFRDPKIFETLRSSIFPMLFKNRTADEPIRIWIAGCSTGEEAYSIAICLHEFLGEKAAKIPIQIFASDISEIAIKKARAGIYSKADVQILSNERVTNYFHKTYGEYEVNKVIRDMCIFAPHNFLKDPPFAKMDLISCRNVLIYLDKFLQKKALITFHYSLKQSGFLLLGKSETASLATELFSIYDKHDKIYSRKPIPGRFMHVATERKEETLASQTKFRNIPETMHTDFRKSGEAMLLSKYTPAAVIVNEQMDIVHINGIITPFLEPSPGKPTFNLLKMAREGLGFELRNALHKVKTTHEPFVKRDIPSMPNDEAGQGIQHLVSIEVVPLTNTVEPYYLILFSKTAMRVAAPLFSGKGVNQKLNEEANQRIAQLEKELSQAREDMRSITEDQEVANEELQSGNEELQSSNEEMQSLNEELETSKEELQSTNEELTIVNSELMDKQEQLNVARHYSENIIATIRDPLIVLDKNLRIKTASASFYKKFNTTEEETEGKLFYEIQSNQWDDEVMRSLLEKILPEKEQLSDFEIIFKFPLLGERHMLLNGRQIIDETTAQKLILLAIEDITDQKIKEHEKDDFISIASHELKTPLTTAKGYIELLLLSLNEENGGLFLYASKADYAINRLQALIAELLDVGKMQHGKFDYNITTFDFNKLIDETIEDVQLNTSSHQIIKTGTVSIEIAGDKDRLQQVLINLLTNAIKYSPTCNEVLVNVTVKDKLLQASIKDYGIGISSQHLDRIFERFYRVQEQARHFQGMGIGLYISYEIIKRHQGKMWAESELGKGSTFYFTIPV
ncbi:MAG: chemotaxis protein CheB [Chitinophagaceae bacterium]